MVIPQKKATEENTHHPQVRWQDVIQCKRIRKREQQEEKNTNCTVWNFTS